ncbi:unnamed protein product [Spirodela intermedia]|uniref:Uncharacterized protein n=1 Tax=Spirodela intermedia TaxID=51605 RepID=A0A7I8LLU8_SPIIN|nr:unnamed protein product [Spirodela intermedia]
MDMGRERRPHSRASSVDLLFYAPREETHDRCRHCHHWKGLGEGGGGRDELTHLWCAAGGTKGERSKSSP